MISKLLLKLLFWYSKEKSLNKIIISPFSLVTLPIVIFNQEKKIATGTGFIYRFNERLYLITNWHVVTGRDPLTNTCKDKYLREPDYLNVRSRFADINTLSISGLPIFDDDGKPLWYEHPTHKQKVDVVALDLPEALVTNNPVAVNDSNLMTKDMYYSVADDLFILGYPLGITVESTFPIWKRATIASEPDIDYDSLPLILVDSATKEGMSGSPVILRSNGSYINTDGCIILGGGSNIGAAYYKFIGTYSGRINVNKEDPFDAQLGLVWKERVIEEILNAKLRGTKPDPFPNK